MQYKNTNLMTKEAILASAVGGTLFHGAQNAALKKALSSRTYQKVLADKFKRGFIGSDRESLRTAIGLSAASGVLPELGFIADKARTLGATTREELSKRLGPDIKLDLQNKRHLVHLRRLVRETIKQEPRLGGSVKETVRRTIKDKIPHVTGGVYGLTATDYPVTYSILKGLETNMGTKSAGRTISQKAYKRIQNIGKTTGTAALTALDPVMGVMNASKYLLVIPQKIDT